MIIQPPTDNLYKFMAIFGLILWIGGGLYPWSKAFELESELINLEAEVAAARENVDHASPIVLKQKIEQTKLKFWAVKVFLAFGLVSTLVGGFLAFLGFRWWYSRVQEPLDAQLSSAVDRATRRSPRTRKSGAPVI